MSQRHSSRRTSFARPSNNDANIGNMNANEAGQIQAPVQEYASAFEMPGAFPEENRVDQDWTTFTDADWAAWEEQAGSSAPSSPSSQDYFTADEALDSEPGEQQEPDIWRDHRFAQIPQAPLAQLEDPSGPYKWPKTLPFQPEPGPPPQTPYQPYSQPYRPQHARPFYPSPPGYAPMPPAWQQPSFPPPPNAQPPSGIDPMQLILMNQMMMQQMAQQQQQMYAAQMMAMQSRQSNPCAATGPVNVQTCGGQREGGEKVLRPVPATPEPVETLPPVPEVSESKDIWQEASIIFCLLVVIFVYLLSNSKERDKAKKESERELVSRVMR